MNSGRMSAVIFDMDGVLIDTEPLFKRVSQKAARDLGYVLRDDLFAELSGLPGARVEEAMYRELGRDFDLDTFMVRCDRYWDEHIKNEGIDEKPGVSALLDALAERRCAYAVATSTALRRARESLDVAGLGKRIDIIVAGDQVRNGKPAPDIFLEAAVRLNSKPERCIVIEDSAAGIQGAAAAGMKPIMVPDAQQPSAAVAALAYRVVPSIQAAARIVLELLQE